MSPAPRAPGAVSAARQRQAAVERRVGQPRRGQHRQHPDPPLTRHRPEAVGRDAGAQPRRRRSRLPRQQRAPPAARYAVRARQVAAPVVYIGARRDRVFFFFLAIICNGFHIGINTTMCKACWPLKTTVLCGSVEETCF